MEANKTKIADLEPKKVIFMEVGLIIALVVVLLAFNYRFYERSGMLNIQVKVDDTPEEIIPITKQEVKPAPPPPPKQVTVISIIKKNEEEGIEIVEEANQEKEIDNFVPVVEVEKEIDEKEIFLVVESMPGYPGGDAARIKFLQDNIKYPQMARESGIQGTIYVSFVVETDGSVTDVRVLRSIGGGCDEEAIRVINRMPKWNAGKQRGRPVRVQFNMPITFTLQG